MRPVLAPLLLLAACAEPPAVTAVNARLSGEVRAAAAPPLLPLGPLLAAVDARAPAPQAGNLAGRIARLEARAEALRAPVLDPADRRRLGGR